MFDRTDGLLEEGEYDREDLIVQRTARERERRDRIVTALVFLAVFAAIGFFLYTTVVCMKVERDSKVRVKRYYVEGFTLLSDTELYAIAREFDRETYPLPIIPKGE